MQTIARAAMGAATRIYSDELDAIIDRHFPKDSVEYYIAYTTGTTDNVYRVVSRIDGWEHECSDLVTAKAICGIMNRNGR